MTVEEIVARAINPDAWWNHDNGFVTRDEAGKLAIVEPSMRRATAALRALEEAGWVCVPREATASMLIQASLCPYAAPNHVGVVRLRHAWRDMIAASRAMLDAAGGGSTAASVAEEAEGPERGV